MPKFLLRISLVLCLALLANALYAQISKQKEQELVKKIMADPKVSTVRISSELQTPSVIVFDQKSAGYDKSQAPVLLNRYLNARKGVDQLQKINDGNLPGNFQVVEFAQFFRGIRVELGGFKILAKDNALWMMNGKWYEMPLSVAGQPALSKSQALQKARASVNAKKYATEFIEEEIMKASDPNVRKALAEEKELVSPKGELVYIRDFTKKGVDMRLAWKFDIYAVEPMSRAWIYVDALNGNILFSDAIIKHANPDPPTSVTITVNTRYAGQRTIKVKQISGNDPHSGTLLVSSHPTTEVYVPGTATWALIDDTRGKGIETYDLNGVGGVPLSVGAFYAQGKSFTDVDNNWSLFEHKRSDPLNNGLGENGPLEAENDDIGWDAHWGAEMVYDYWLQKHNRRSFDGRDAKIKSFIHFGLAYDNAFWNGSAMTYGDGSGPSAQGFRALTSLDVCAHEIGHGVCTFTSNLVYARESGAMNEGFSDIWAACVERFAITSIDPSLVSRYRPFYIGEQIGATADDPLRRMDNPKATGDPDTYGGLNWQDPNCETPDLLLNDFCGVHTNSGLLNKWFYLMTVGSGAGSGPDAQYARPDSDDGVNDLGSTYSVTGLGFDISEQIAFMTEVMLSQTATFAEARELSILAATAISGDACSEIVKSVTNAWYAVGVGPAFNPSCVSTYGFVFQPGRTVSEAEAPGGCTGESLVRIPVLLPPNSTASVTSSGSAVLNVDYRLGSSGFSNAGTANSVVHVEVFLKGDAVTEVTETIGLNISITNTGSNPVNTGYVLSISDDDITPVIGNGSLSLMSGGDFSGIPDGYNTPAGWNTVVDIPGVNLWGVWGGQLRITGNVEGVQLQPGQYNNLSETSTYISGPQIDARGLSNIRLRFSYRVQGEMDVNGANPDTWGIFDYMTVVYSFDGVNYQDLRILSDQFKAFCSMAPAEGIFEGLLPAEFNNKVFYIGFKWYNDTNAGGPESVSVDNVTVEASPRLIESELNDNGRENMGAGTEAYYYSIQDGEVLAKFNNNSAKNFGCTNIYVERAGNGSFNLYQGRSGLHKTADKVLRIEASIATKATSVVTLFFTEQQLAALESATGQNRDAFKVYHVNAAAYQLAANNNTDILDPVYTLLTGVGGTFTVTLTNKMFANGSYALGCPVSLFAKGETSRETEVEPEGFSIGNIYPNPGQEDAYINISSLNAQKLSVEYLNAAGQVVARQSEQVGVGQQRLKLRTHSLANGLYYIRFRDEEGRLLGSRTFIRN